MPGDNRGRRNCRKRYRWGRFSALSEGPASSAASTSAQRGRLATVCAMRHVAALLAAILIAPLSWLMLAIGQDRPDRTITGALACVVAAGLLLGLVATVRLSRLGVALTGAAYAVVHVSALAFPGATLGVFPRSVWVAGRSVDPTAPLRTGSALVFAVVLLVTTVGLGRRRSADEPPAEQAPAPAAAPQVIGHRAAGSPRPDNRRWSSFGPAHNDNTVRWRQNRQFADFREEKSGDV